MTAAKPSSEEAVVKALASEGELTPAEIAATTGLGRSTVSSTSWSSTSSNAQGTEVALGATAVANGLGRSSGAVGNCLARLAAAGQVRQVSERPRRCSRAAHGRSKRASDRRQPRGKRS
jgi:hypothetical protein